MSIAFLWSGNERWPAHEIKAGRMHINMLPKVVPGIDVIHWDEREQWTGEYDLVIVQHFTREYSVIEPIRQAFPGALIALRPDRPPEWEAHHLTHRLPFFLDDLAQADIVLDAMPDGRRANFWAKIAHKPSAVLPTPIVPHPELEALRKRKRDNLIVAWLHPSEPRQPLPTLAALAAIQQVLDMEAVVINADESARELAAALGVWAIYEGAPSHEGFIDLLSRASLVLDLFPMHTPGRVATIAAWLGTPTVTGFDTPDLCHPRVDVWSGTAPAAALEMLGAATARKAALRAGYKQIEAIHSPAAAKKYVDALVTFTSGKGAA